MSRFSWSEGEAELDHIGILTDEFDAVARLFGDQLGLDVGPPEEDLELGLSFLWVRGSGVPLEFIVPLSDQVAAASRLRERGPGVDHFAYKVDSVADSLSWCRDRSIPCLDEVPRRGAHGTRIAFLDPAATGGARVELVEHVDR
jgi:methylmalonyl-CoA/ethylmalonyl-CoA epimerase